MASKKVFVSEHALMRARQRLGVSRKDVRALARRALSEGACGRHLPELAVSAAKWPRSDFRVLDGNVFVFVGKTLVTVYKLEFYNREAS